jgi:Acyl-CoA carboxylase epsilon subunit
MERNGISIDAVTTPEERRALFRVVRGAPSDEELVALTVTLAAVAVGGPEPASAPCSVWNAPKLRTALHPGPGAWRASTWPR